MLRSRSPSARRARFAILGCALLASTGGAAIKAAAFSPLEVAGLRAGLAALVLLAVLRPSRGSWSRGAFLVGTVQAVMMALFVTANKLTTAASAIYIQSTAPLYVVLLGPLLLRERVRPGDLAYLAVLLGALSLFFVSTDVAQPTAPEPLAGNLVAAASGLGWALTVIGLRWLAAQPADAKEREANLASQPAGDPAAAATVIANLLVFLVILGSRPWIGAVPVNTSLADWIAIAWLGVFQVGLAYVLLTRGLRHLPAFEVSLLLLAEPVLSPLWAWLLHGERPGRWALAGGAIILVATLARVLPVGRQVA